MRCLHCGSDKIQKRGFANSGEQRYKCTECGKWGQAPLIPGGARILLFDIETTPMECFVWALNSKSNNYISHNNIIADWNILSWSAKWLCDSEVMSDIQTPVEARARNDERICKSIHKLITDADVVIAHNGDRFDIKKLNTRFYLNGLEPPTPFQSIDTLKIVKRSFSFSSNRLDYLGKIMKNKGKLETNFNLWKDCLNGNKESLDKMLAYNEEDVRLLEEVYIELRPWMKSHPNIAIHLQRGKPVCPSCGSEEIGFNGSYYTTGTNMYESYRCRDCGSLSRKMQGELPLTERRELMRVLPR